MLAWWKLFIQFRNRGRFTQRVMVRAVERCGVNLIEETTNTKHTHQRSEAL